MKYAIVIPAGAPDEPLVELEGRTPLAAAQLPALDRLAAEGRTGTARTIPEDRPCAAEIALLSVFGYDPREYVAPRGPLEALGRGLHLAADDAVLRCNLVTLDGEVLQDFTAGYIPTADAEAILAVVRDSLQDEAIHIEPGRSYRHLLVWKGVGALPKVVTTAPQDVLDKPIRKFLPRGRGSDRLRELMLHTHQILADHDLNAVRRDLGETPANGIWLYGNGPLPNLPKFHARFGLRGAMVAGADLPRGLARMLGWTVLDVPGATGLPDTNYAAKGRAAAQALEEHDLVCVHVEAADEASHMGNAGAKIRVLEAIDRDIVAPLHERLRHESAWRMLVLPDHATGVARRVHLGGATLFVMAGTGVVANRGNAFDEESAAIGELHVEHAWDLMEYFLRR